MSKKMNKKKKEPLKIGHIFRNLITALAVINLVLLFGLNYNVPGISYIITKIENNRDHIDGITQSNVASDSNVTFEYADEELTYSGDGALDVCADVTVKDEEGNELDKSGLTAQISGDSDKEISYSYKSEDGQYYGSTSRVLNLENYEGPAITVNEDIPTLDDDNLVDVADICREISTVTDGYGNDISENLTVLATPTEDFDGTFDVKLSVTNVFGDTAVAEQEVVTDFDKPHLKLSAEEINVNKGSSFDPADYILYAVDKDGSDLSSQVETDGDVDTQTAGDYKVKYDLTNDDDQSVKTKVLKVHVVE